MVRQEVTLERGDLGSDWLEWAREEGEVGCDIETSGLDWRKDKIRTVQIAIADKIAVVQLSGDENPLVLADLLGDPSVTKVFHHASFDLRFISNAWKMFPKSIACTKVAAKIVSPRQDNRAYSLKPTLRKYLKVDIDKGAQLSDWAAESLSDDQLNYAANDVRYLVRLLRALLTVARENGATALVEESFRYLTTRSALDVMGVGDVFSY